MPLEQRLMLEKARIKNPVQFELKRQEACNRGNYIHKVVEAAARGVRIPQNVNYSKHLQQLRPFLRAIAGASFFMNEQQIHDLEVGYAGTFDLVTELDDCMTLIDIKTAAYQIWPGAKHSALLQTAAYAAAWNKQQHALRANAIAAVFVTPYKLEIYRHEGSEMAAYISEFYQRVRLYGMRRGEQSVSA